MPVDFRLYLVTDRSLTGGRPLIPVIAEALSAGLRAVQVRERDLDTRSLCRLATDLSALAQVHHARLLINDRTDVAVAVGSDGVHLRSDSMPVAAARRVVGDGRLIAVSTHSVQQARRAEDEGADFVVLGPIYETPSKVQYGAPLGLQPLTEAARVCRIPVFAIGGIGPTRISEVRRAGAYGVAVVSAILGAADAAAATRTLMRALDAAW